MHEFALLWGIFLPGVFVPTFPFEVASGCEDRSIRHQKWACSAAINSTPANLSATALLE